MPTGPRGVKGSDGRGANVSINHQFVKKMWETCGKYAEIYGKYVANLSEICGQLVRKYVDEAPECLRIKDVLLMAISMGKMWDNLGQG